MKKLTIREVRQSLSNLDRLLATEGEVAITRRGETIALIRPIRKYRIIPSHQCLRERMRRMRKGSEKMICEDRERR
jgi:antitoxin (DNA-binding transcriptional repressor) of toxin-antitoxin stability system